MIQKWTKLSSEVFHENKWWKGIHDRFRLPDGKEGDYYFLSTLGGVAIFPVDEDGRVLLNRQYRYIFDKVGLEVYAGGVKKDQTILEAAQAELAEEAGFSARSLEQVGSFAVGAGLLDEIGYVFVAKGLFHAEAQQDETESFEHLRLTPTEIDEAIAKGEMWDGFSISAWTLAKPHLKI